jgi:hypothetical protein
MFRHLGAIFVQYELLGYLRRLYVTAGDKTSVFSSGLPRGAVVGGSNPPSPEIPKF